MKNYEGFIMDVKQVNKKTVLYVIQLYKCSWHINTKRYLYDYLSKKIARLRFVIYDL